MRNLASVPTLLAVFIAIGWVFVSSPGQGQTMAIWMADLTEQASADHGCKVKLVSQVMEATVDGRQTVLAKVHCEDGRAFDVYRPDAYTDFQFSECESRGRSSC